MVTAMAHVTKPHRPTPHPQPGPHRLPGHRQDFGGGPAGRRCCSALSWTWTRCWSGEAGRSVADIVAQGGWAEFRRLEKELVARYRDARGQVLATGGGVVLDPDNVAALRENGIIIWLTADPAAIQARLAQDQPRDANRPSLTGEDTIREVAGSG